MKYNELKVSASKSRTRAGRGISAGRGKTAGRGTKGQGSRTGSKFGATFMGGQGKLVQRIPKKSGFRSLRVKAQVIYTSQINDIKGSVIDADTLFEAGLVATPYHSVKLIAKGECTSKATVRLQSASAGAVKLLEKSGGKFEPVNVVSLPKSAKKDESTKA